MAQAASKKILVHVDGKDWRRANAAVAAARPKIEVIQEAAAAALNRLDSLKADFFKIARAV